MGNTLEIVKVLVSPLEKLMEITQNGIGILYEPKHKRKMADAISYEIETICESMRNNSDIILNYNTESLTAQIPALGEFVERTKNRLAYQEILKQHNIESVIDCAYSNLEGSENVSDDPLDSNWISSFFDFVANVSNEQMQTIWGKILSGEIIKPGSFSIRTLDAVRKMSQKEAEAFERLIPLVLICDGDESKTYKDYFVFDDLYGVEFTDLISLQESGILTSNNMISVSIIIQQGDAGVIENMFGKIEFVNNNSCKISISKQAYLLTEVGRDLYSIMKEKSFSKPIDYLEHCKDYFLEIGGAFDSLNAKEKENIVSRIVEI